MKKFMSFLLASSVGLSFANTKSNTNIGEGKSAKKQIGGFELGVGLYQLNYEISGESPENLQGYTLIGAKEFVLPKNFLTKSQLEIGNVQNQNGYDGFDTDTSFTHLNFTQSLAYAIEQGGVVIKPFIALGIGSGVYNQKIDGLSAADQASLGINSISVESNYSSVIRTIGLQATFANGLSPFISYNVRSLNFTGPETSFNKNGAKEDVGLDNVELENSASSSFNIGLSYHF